MTKGLVFRVLGTSWPIWTLRVGRNFWFGMRHKNSRVLPRVVCLCGAVGVCGRDLLGAEASGRHALHGETLLCGSHHVVRRLENIGDLREMWLVVH